MSTHKYLDTTGLGQVWGKIKDYADDAKTMLVTVSRSNGNYVADKTFSEIIAHINAGGNVVCKNNNGGDFQNEIYELGTIENDYIIFHLTQLYDVDNNNDGYSDQVWFLASHIIISNNNAVEVGDVVNGPLPDASTTTPLAPGVASRGTEYERYALGDHVHPSELFVVNVTSTTSNGTTTFSADKTFAEITAAYNAGKLCRAVRNINNNSSVYTLIAINSNRLYFTFNSASNDTLESTTLGVIRITNTNEVSAYSKSIPTLSAIRSRFAQKPEIAIVNGSFNNNTNVYDFSATAVQAYSTGDLFWLNYNVLAKATTDIASGATLTENTNYVKTTIADELKSAGEQSDWEEDDSTNLAYINNKPAIKAGDGDDSVMVGSLDQYSTFQEFPITITIDANDLTKVAYTSETPITLPSTSIWEAYALKYTYGTSSVQYLAVESIDTTNNIITLRKNTILSSANPSATLYYYYKTSDGAYSVAEGLGTIASGSYAHAEGVMSHALGSSTHAEGNRSTAAGQCSHAEGQRTFAYSSPYGGAHAEGFRTEATGQYGSHAEGYFSIASGNESHAEGNYTTASSQASHAEGCRTKTSGDASHAEGYFSAATYGGAHAEGWKGTSSVTLTGDANALTYTVTDGPFLKNTNRSSGIWIEYNSTLYPSTSITLDSNGILTSITLESTLNDSAAFSASVTIHIGNVASGIGSHAEGEATHAKGAGSHAEGLNSIANSEISHVEGTHTIASSAYQHVQGKNNIEDSTGTYAHIVGNGIDSSNRSNAHTLDWNGNGWYAGKLTVGAAPTNNMDVATKGYVDGSISSAQSDWAENDSTEPDYIKNRTHYKVSLGNGLNIDLLDSVNIIGISENSYTDESTNITYNYSYNYLTSGSIYLHFHSDYNNYFPNYIDDIDITVTETTAIIDGIEHTLTLYNGLNTEYPFISYYDNTISFWLYDTIEYDGSINSNVDTIGIDIEFNTIPTTSFSLTIPILQEQFEWHKLDNNYLNGSLIVFGDGKYSEIYNGYPEADSHGIRSKLADGDYSHVEGEDSIQEITFNISGEANVTTYHITYLQPYRAEFKDLINSELYILNSSSGEYEASGIYITEIPFDSVGNFTGEFTFSETLDANNDYSGVGKLYITGSKASGRASHSEGKANQALGSYSHAEGYNNVSYADYSHAEGYNTVAQGLHSHVEGSYTYALGNDSHAEGSYTYALGNGSHAEGDYSRAIGSRSHAEGYDTVAQGSYSHSEGIKTIARGAYSHAEGSGSYSLFRLWLTGDANATTYTVTNFTNIYGMHPKALIGLTISEILITGVTYTNNTPSTITLESTLSTSNISNKSYYTSVNLNIASGESAHVQNIANRAYGNGSHSEGYLNVAYAYYTHAEGAGTIASSQNQHVQGKYNIEDTSSTYAHIVGNGTASVRSNAHTLDWNGNGWYAGKLTVGTAPTNDLDVATKKYVDDAVSGFSTSLSGLSDTTITSPSNEQMLVYNSTSSKWENATLALALSGNTIQLKQGNTVISSISLPVYNGGVSS